MQTPYTLIIPSWYPTATQPLNGIFIEKHVQVISSFRPVIVMYITASEADAMSEEIISDTYIKVTYTYAESASRAINQLKYIWAQKRAWDHITAKHSQPADLHLHVAFPAGIFVYLLLLFKNIPLLITEHWSGYTSEDSRYQRQPGVIKYMTRQLFAKAKKISAVSQYLKQAIVHQGLAHAGKISIVSNFLNIPVQPLFHERIDAYKALFIGNLNDHEKNISMLIGAVEIVAQKYPSFTLTMIGGGGESQKFIDLAKSNGLLDKNIFFKGYVPNALLIDYYRSHSFFILTSNFETFNIAAAEALLSGLPVVSTPCGGPSEYINERTGIWIEEKTPEAIAAAVIEMIDKRSTFDSDRIAAEMRIKYSYQRIADELKALYQPV